MREQYMEQLKDALQHVNPEIQQEILDDFEAHFEAGMDEGKTEEELEEELGDPIELAKQLEEEYGRFEVPARGQECANGQWGTDEEETEQREFGDGAYIYEDNNHVIRAMKLEMVIADIRFVPSPDGVFRVKYENSVRSSLFRNRLRYRTKVWRDTFVAREELHHANGHAWAAMEVQIPEDFVHIEVRSTRGDVTIEGIKVKYDITLDTVSGDMEFAKVSADEIYIKSVSGDISFDTVQANKMRLKTVSGDFSGVEVQSTDMVWDSVSGDFDGNELVGERVELQSKSGDIKGKLAGEDGYRLDAQSLSGDVRLPRMEKASGFKVGAKYQGVVGLGVGKVYAKTLSGDVTIME